MGDPAAKKPADTTAVEITAAEAAKAVKRLVPVLKDGKPTGETKEVAVKADELFAWTKRGDRIVVVTIDGQKLEGTL